MAAASPEGVRPGHDEKMDVEAMPGSTEHVSDAGKPHEGHEYILEREATDLPKGYFKSVFFWGSMMGIGIGLTSGVAGFAFAAPVLSMIDSDIGPSKNIAWVALVYNLTLAVVFTIVGRISDIFGRRYIFLGGSFLGIVGTIICATANSVNMFIGGMTVIGIAAATQLSYYYVMGEIVPMQYRMIGNAFCYMFTVPGSGVSPLIVTAFIERYPGVSWRGAYYVLIGTNTLSFLCWFFFYHPPTFTMKQGRNAKLGEYIKNFDYVGTVLFTGGLLILMMGLNWGGTVYPWKSAHVIAAIISGAFGLVLFVVWENVAKLKEPLVPMHLFRNTPWLAATVLSGVGASIYYALAVVWPAMVNDVYPTDNLMTNATYQTLMGLMVQIGEVLGGVMAKPIGRVKYQIIFYLVAGGTFIAATASSTPDTKGRATAFVALGSFFNGAMESLAISTVTLTVWDQTNLGTASGVAGSIRFFISCIASIVYVVVQNNRLASELPAKVPKALLNAGLPASSVEAFMTDLTTGTGYDNVPGINQKIIAAGTRASKVAYANTFGTVYLVSLAFTGIALVACYFLPDIDLLLSNKVSSTLHRGKDTEHVLGEKSSSSPDDSEK